MVAAPTVQRVSRSAGLFAQAARVARGESADPDSIGSLSDVVPLPSGFRLLGVTIPDRGKPAGVVGLSASGSVNQVADTYLAAMASHGWRTSRTDKDLGFVVMHRKGAPSGAVVMFRPVDASSVSVIIQVQ